MLVLSRKRGQRITIGDVVITIIHTGGTSAKIGIAAPDHILISRDDVKKPTSPTAPRIALGTKRQTWRDG